MPLFMMSVVSLGNPKYRTSILSMRPTCSRCRRCSKVNSSLRRFCISSLDRNPWELRELFQALYSLVHGEIVITLKLNLLF